MARRAVDGVDGLIGLVGREPGSSEWLTITRNMVDRFADLPLAAGAVFRYFI